MKKKELTLVSVSEAALEKPATSFIGIVCHARGTSPESRSSEKPDNAQEENWGKKNTNDEDDVASVWMIFSHSHT